MLKSFKIIFTKNFLLPLKKQDGQAAIIIGLTITALIGVMAFVIDSGSIYESRRSFQTVADSAALAAAQELPENPSGAVGAAIEYAQLHQVTINPENVQISSTLASNDTVTVTAYNLNKKLFFGWIFNKPETAVGAKATALVGTPAVYNNMAPFGIPEEEWIPGRSYTLKAGTPGSPGNFQALALGGSGASVYEENITYGANVSLSIGDWVNTEPGNMSNPTHRGTDARVKEQDDFVLNSLLELARPVEGGYELKRNDSQLILCPIIPEFPAGRDEVLILQFVPFLITEYHGDTVTGVFLNKSLIIYDGEIVGADQSGNRVIRLIN